MIINKRQWIHRITAVLLIVMTGMAATVQMTSAAENSSAKKSENTSTSLKEAQQEKAALEKALEKAKQTINELKESKGKPACTEKSGADREEGSDRGHKRPA